MKVYDKAAWHIDGNENPKEVVARFNEIFKFLAENKLLSPDGEEIYELGIDSSASLNSSMVTKDGAQFLKQYYDEVLKKNPDMCALLDVSSHEPLWPWSPLYWRKNCFLTPHIAGCLSNEEERMVEYMVQAYRDTLEGKQNPCETSLELIAKQSTH